MEEYISERLGLFQSTRDHIWVKWHEGRDLKIIGKSPTLSEKIGSKSKLDEIVAFKDLALMESHLSLASSTISVSSFESTLDDQPKFECFSQRTNDSTLSLWIIEQQAKDEMLTLEAAAHDLRAPINSITSMVTMVQQVIKEGDLDPEELNKLMDLIMASSHQAMELINDIMKLAELEAPSIKLKTKEVLARDFLSNYVKTHRLLTFRKKIKINFSSKSEAMVCMNELLITRVLDNLITNSVKFSSAGSTIHLSILRKTNHVVLAIRDEGIGMSDKLMKNIFVKFGRAKRRGLSGEISHGLGMSIVKRIMDLHEGKIEIYSQVDVGTEVRLVFKNEAK